MNTQSASSIKIIVFTAMLTLLGSFAGMSQAFAEFQRTKIAVLDFELIGDKMETSGMGAILSEWFITGIVKSGRFDVVERAMLQKIITEQKLSSTGAIDESSAAALGKILGVKVIITGSVLKLRDTVEINSRVISVESGSIIAAENTRSGINSDLHALVDDLITRILQNFPLTGYIVKKDKEKVIIDLGLDSGLTSDTEFIVYKEGEVIKHPKTGEVLDVVQIVTGQVRITKVSKNVAEGQILSEQPGGIEYGHLVKSVPKETGKAKPKQQDKAVEKPVIKDQPVTKEPPAHPATAAPKEADIVKPNPQEKPADKPGIKEAPTVKEPPVQVEPQKPAPEVKREAKSEKKKSVPQAAPPPVVIAPPPASTAPPPAIKEPVVVKEQFDGFKAAIFPFLLSGDAKPYSGVFAERIFSRIGENPNITLIKSYYNFKGIGQLTGINGADVFSGSAPELAFLTKKGLELGVNLAILGRMDIRCKDSSQGTNNCDIRSTEIVIVNLTKGKVYSHSARAGIRSTPEEAIDEACKGVFAKFAVDMPK